MKKLSPKAKNTVSLIAVFAVGIAVVALLMGQANAGAVNDADSSSDASTSSAEIVLGTPEPITPESSSSDTGSAFVPSSGAAASKPLTVASKPTSQPPKPTPPASSALTNKSKKPTYSSKPTASTSSTSKVTSAPKGKSYMPGFGYVDGTGGGQAVSEPDVGGDIHKQVGTMD